MSLTTKARRWAVIGALAAGTVVWGSGLIPAPRVGVQALQPYSAAYSNTTGQADTGITEPAQVPTAPATTPALPAEYGTSGLAGKYAEQLGHPSLSAACSAGIDWTCNVTRVKAAVNYDGKAATTREVYVNVPPMDPNAVAAEFLDRSPAGITTVRVNDTSSFVVQTVGTATRSKSGADQ